MHWTTSDLARNALAYSRHGDFFSGQIARTLYYRALIGELGSRRAVILEERLRRLQHRAEAEYCITANR